jgi:hypothetical protein
MRTHIIMRETTGHAALLTRMAFVLSVASCTQAPNPTIKAPIIESPAAIIVPPTLPRTDMVTDPHAVESARNTLRLLGYGGGKPSGAFDPALERGLLAFQKDQGLDEDGRLTFTLADRLKGLRAELPKAPSQRVEREEVFVYSDGSVRSQPINFFSPSNDGLVSDAPPSFLQPLRPGAQGSFHLGHIAKDGTMAPVATVSCRVGRISVTDVPAGSFDTIATDCRENAKGHPSRLWRWSYALKLGQIVRQETSAGAGGTLELVAIRPVTTDWPSAARIGLDWAVTHSLEAQTSNIPVRWSSTGISQHFEIRAYTPITPGETGLPGSNNSQSCRRFELVRVDEPQRHYPGIACKNPKGNWYIPASRIQFASPATGLD